MSQATRSDTTIPTRRAFLAGAPAVAAAALAAGTVVSGLAVAAAVPSIEPAPSALAPALAAPSPDVRLLQLFEEYLTAWSEFRRLVRVEGRMEQKYIVRVPKPKEMFVRPGDAELGLPDVLEGSPYDSSYFLSILELKKPEWPVISAIEPPSGTKFSYLPDGDTIYFASPSAAARARANEIIEADDKWRRMQRRARHPALRTAERQSRAASKLADRLRARIDRTRAYTAAGLAVKAQVAAIEGAEDTQFADTTIASILRDMRALRQDRGRAVMTTKRKPSTIERQGGDLHRHPDATLDGKVHSGVNEQIAALPFVRTQKGAGGWDAL